jgi:hypothetical protein
LENFVFRRTRDFEGRAFDSAAARRVRYMRHKRSGVNVGIDTQRTGPTPGFEVRLFPHYLDRIPKMVKKKFDRLLP